MAKDWLERLDRWVAGVLGVFFATGAVACTALLVASGNEVGVAGFALLLGLACAYFAVNFLYLAATGRNWLWRAWLGSGP